jgi:hypothetical protein
VRVRLFNSVTGACSGRLAETMRSSTPSWRALCRAPSFSSKVPQAPPVQVSGGLFGLGGAVQYPTGQEPAGAFHGQLSASSHCSIAAAYW